MNVLHGVGLIGTTLVSVVQMLPSVSVELVVGRQQSMDRNQSVSATQPRPPAMFGSVAREIAVGTVVLRQGLGASGVSCQADAAWRSYSSLFLDWMMTTHYCLLGLFRSTLKLLQFASNAIV